MHTYIISLKCKASLQFLIQAHHGRQDFEQGGVG